MSEAVWPAPPEGVCILPATLDAEVAILGAGIHGAALAREFTLRGVSCALVDRGEVGGGTSQWSSQLLHGGIRYMLTGDIRQMREGLVERATWSRIAPRRCHWEAFWMPHRSWPEGMAHRIGIGLYDHWGSERPGWPAELRLGVPSSVFEADPRAAGGPFRGATAYADLMTWDRDLTRDLAASSDALNLDFHDVVSFEDTSGDLRTAILRDRRDGTERRLSARRWVFALGPWTDGAMASWFGEERKRLRLSSGIHLWFDSVPGCERPWAIRRPKGRILFVIPRDGRLQVGTTEREVDDGWGYPILEAEREELFEALAANLPAIPWRSLPLRAEELGVRPLVAASGLTTHLSREAVLERHPRFRNLTLVLGGKLTTARALMDRLATDLTGTACPASRTAPLRVWDGQNAQIR